jgi:hypothetical protein
LYYLFSFNLSNPNNKSVNTLVQKIPVVFLIGQPSKMLIYLFLYINVSLNMTIRMLRRSAEQTSSVQASGTVGTRQIGQDSQTCKNRTNRRESLKRTAWKWQQGQDGRRGQLEQDSLNRKERPGQPEIDGIDTEQLGLDNWVKQPMTGLTGTGQEGWDRTS